jgi:hypothetical protein
MNPYTNIITILYLFTLISSSAQISKKTDLFQNVKVEFYLEYVKNGILEKFDSFYEKVNEEEEILDEEQYEDEWVIEETTNDLDLITENQEPFIQNEPVSPEFKEFAERICLLTALSKETTIYFYETIQV